MKIITQYLVLWALLAGLLFGQVETVKKSPGNDEITEDLVIPEGRALTVDGTLTVNGLDVGSVSSQFAARQMAGYGISDGATANRGEILTPGAIGDVAGLPMSFLAVIDVGTSDPSLNSGVIYIGDSTSPNFSTGGGTSNASYAYITTGGSLQIRVNGAAGSNYRRLIYTDFRTAYSGRNGLRLAIVFPEGNSTTSPRIEVDGVDVTGSFALSTAGVIPNWIPTALETTKYLWGYQWSAGRSPYVRAIIGALSTAESATWGTTGELPTWATKAGSAVNPIANSGFETTGSEGTSVFANWWGGANLTTSAETSDPYVGANSLRLTGGGALSSTLNNHLRAEPFGLDNFGAPWTPGQYGRVTFAAKHVSGGSLYFGNAYVSLKTVASGDASGWTEFEWSGIITSSSGYAAPVFGAASSAVWLIDKVVFLQEGLIDDPYYQPALATGDRLGRMSRRLLGITPMVALGVSEVVISHTLSWDGTNHTAQSLTGGKAFEAGFVPTMISLVPDAASSGDGWTIGTSADADQYKTVASYSTGKTIYTQADFASRVPGGTGATNLDLLIDPDTANYTGSIEVTIYGSNTAGSP